VLPSCVDAGLARRTGLAEHRRTSQMMGVPWSATSEEAHWAGLSGPIWPATLELADRAAAAFGLELRFPFFDRRLIEFCLALPMGQRLDLGWTRVILRRAMRGILPEEVRQRVGKQDLSPNYVRGLRGNDRELLSAALHQQGPLAGYADLAALRAAYDRFVSNTDRVYWRQDCAALYRAAVLTRWLKATTFA
jgi:asparagine synthase (glutamine-hydrolysing)